MTLNEPRLWAKGPLPVDKAHMKKIHTLQGIASMHLNPTNSLSATRPRVMAVDLVQHYPRALMSLRNLFA